MSLLREDEWPEIGELVVASVNRITHYGVYVMLDEYEKEGFLHVSEISSSWVKNIRDFVHEGEKAVLKVLRVDPERKHIDLSLRRVTKREKRERILLWKQSKKAESLLRSASQRLGISVDDLYEKAWGPLEEAFGEAYDGLERAAREGVEVLLEHGLPKELAEVLTEIAKDKIRISMVKVKGTLKMSCPKPDGVLQIKKALKKAEGVKIPRGSDIRIYVVSPPKYRVEVKASDYKQANAIMKRISEAAVDGIVKAGGEGVFERG
ncbi:MAG: translation initiation factor IF-2 subunit alpha [Candidatus Bathyarchaeota archaeon]|nr:translation initiation factor IF-2 subunit alpha [Candidatus Bathyarchaeota archaeon]